MKKYITISFLLFLSFTLFGEEQHIKIGQYQTVEAIKEIQQGKSSANNLIIKKIDGVELQKPLGANFQAVKYFHLYIDLSKVKNSQKIIAKGFFTYEYVGLPNMPEKDWQFGTTQAKFQRVLFVNVAKFIEPANIAKEYEDLKNKELKKNSN